MQKSYQLEAQRIRNSNWCLLVVFQVRAARQMTLTHAVGGTSEEDDRQDPTKQIANNVEQPIAAAENGMNKAPKKMLPEQPHQLKKFKFPPRSFGQEVVKKRSFQAQWFDHFKWLHYDEEMDATFCHVYANAEDNGILSGSARRDAAFLTKGFTNCYYVFLKARSI